MITLHDRRTGDLFDRWSDLGEKRRRLLEKSWAGVFRKHLLEDLPVGELSRRLNAQLGRPSKDLHVVIGVLILQQLHDLSDAATVEALAFNMTWHYALDVRIEADVYFCEKTLRNYRRLFIAEGLDEILFQRLTDRLVRAFDVDTSRQRMDSTALRSAMRSLTRLGIAVETISKFMRELKRFDPALHCQIDVDMIRRYVDREGDGAFANTSPSVSRRRLLEAGQDLLALASQFRGTTVEQLSSFAILERVLRDQFDVVEDASGGPSIPIAVVRRPADVPCDTVGNPADPDSSFNAHKGQGYMAQIVETWSDDDSDDKRDDSAGTPDLITHVEVHKMTVHDGHRVDSAMTGLERRDLKPKTLLGDSHYGSNETKSLMQDRGIDLVAPIPSAKGAVSGRLTLEDFALDASGRVMRCPTGIEPASTSAAKSRLQARFDLSDCRRCPDMPRCLVQADKHGGSSARFQYTPVRVTNRKRRLYEQSTAFLDIYRWRAGIEATMSRLKHQMNLAHLRVRGMPAMRYVVHLRALGLNIHRCARVGQGV